ncbi:flagellar hook capping FlgD N-terminal domain-containing protein [Rhodosalinus sp. K401]|uniref:flagellar hook capping FlgD N-terminal domain-containing protein n=1 Tax=Rhodosalinus sp. K401 TaxID=3239195 RepID=UPI0035250E2F
MQTSPVPPPAFAAGPDRATARTEAGRGALSSDFETFLRMLTVQMQNQDPLNPIESTDFAVQLATFSTVEQQVLTNDLLAQMQTPLAEFANWVGREVLTTAPVTFDGAPVTLRLEPGRAAEDTALVVRDAEGRAVLSQPVPADAETVEWAGVGPAGVPLPHGRYSFTLESASAGPGADSRPVPAFQTVREVRVGPQGAPVIGLASGEEVPAGDVLALRESR